MNARDTEHDDLIEVDAASVDDSFAESLDEESAGDFGDPFVDEAMEDGGLPDDVQAELQALAASDLDGDGELEQALANAQREVARHRAEARAVLARYREAILVAEPDLPPDLVQGETLEDLDAAVASAREVVARVRERVRDETSTRGFPVGAPGRDRRDRGVQGVLTPAEKIARGLEEG